MLQATMASPTLQDMAQHCYRHAVHQQADKQSLRQLSALARHLSGRGDKGAAAQRSVALAKQAVNLDLRDGCSWCKSPPVPF